MSRENEPMFLSNKMELPHGLFQLIREYAKQWFKYHKVTVSNMRLDNDSFQLLNSLHTVQIPVFLLNPEMSGKIKK